VKYPTFEEGWREPSATVITRNVRKGQPERALLPASVEKAAWRELHALAVKTAYQGSPGGPAALQNLSEEDAFDLWVGGLVANKAKVVDATEAVFHLPAAMLYEPSQVIYEQGVRQAEVSESRLLRAVSTYHRELGDNLDRPEMKNRRWLIRSVAAAQFWTDVEQSVPHLLALVGDPTPLGLNEAWHRTVWGRAVWQASQDAFRRACPHESPRQIRAYALGLRTLLATENRSEKEQEREVDA
jgi:hypothetical protein